MSRHERKGKGEALTEREAYYTGLFEEQEERGLSVAAFAEERGLSVATLYSWRRRLGRAATRGHGTTLLEVRVCDDGERCGRMTVVARDGTRIEVGADFNESALERLLATLARC
jgi:hypothetical protein